MIRLLTACLLVAGCIPEHEYKITHPDVMYVGDSLCYKVFDVEMDHKWELWELYDYDKAKNATAQNMVGMRSNCVKSRKVTDVEKLPDGYRILFLALVTNDVGNTPLDEFRLHYQTLVYNVDAGVLYCVLPNVGVDAEPYRQVIRETCANVIDPVEYGVTFRARDTVHMNDVDHRYWSRVLRNILNPGV